jgi:hypothetical protein
VTAQGLLVLYFAAGFAFAALVYVRAEPRTRAAALSACAAFAVWPLWVPFVLTPKPTPRRGPFAARIAHALDGASGRAGFSRLEVENMLRRVELAERRLHELEERLRVTRALVPADSLRTAGKPACEQVRNASITQLEAARDREQRALGQLAELCEVLENQRVLARLDASDRAEELQDELWVRIQALSELPAD